MPQDVYSENPNYPRKDWQQEIMIGDTVLGYWEWAQSCEEVEEYAECEHGYVQGRGCRACEFYERADYEYERSMDR